LVFKFPRLLDYALYLRFFTRVTFALNGIIFKWRFGLLTSFGASTTLLDTGRG